MRADDVFELIRRADREPGTELPKGATESQIKACERRLGIVFPEELGLLLSKHDGANIGAGGIFGIKEIEEHFRTYSSWVGRQLIPIASDGCGNPYVLLGGREGHPVGFIEAVEDENSPAFVVASGLWPFLGFYLRRDAGEMGWPFEEIFVLRRDPLIVRHRELRLPWQA